MFNCLLEFLVRKWRVDCRQKIRTEETPDLIIPISYTTSRHGLVNATAKFVEQAALLKQKYPEAVIVASNCKYTFPGAADREWRLKRALFTQRGMLAYRAADMNNSVEEARVIADYVNSRGLSAKRIRIITGEMHSRSALWIWNRVMPDSEITITCIDHHFEYQNNHPVHVQRGAWRWFFANVARQTLLHMVGLRIERWHHRSS